MDFWGLQEGKRQCQANTNTVHHKFLHLPYAKITKPYKANEPSMSLLSRLVRSTTGEEQTHN
jgi:hypothetical protein